MGYGHHYEHWLIIQNAYQKGIYLPQQIRVMYKAKYGMYIILNK